MTSRLQVSPFSPGGTIMEGTEFLFNPPLPHMREEGRRLGPCRLPPCWLLLFELMVSSVCPQDVVDALTEMAAVPSLPKSVQFRGILQVEAYFQLAKTKEENGLSSYPHDQNPHQTFELYRMPPKMYAHLNS